MDTHRVGRGFEERAARWLEARGWRILERNVRFHRKEVDLVIARDELVAFVEVKGRQNDRYGVPAEAVTWKKRREIESVARWWVERHGSSQLRYRFDVVSLCADPTGAVTIHHLEDAWRPR